MADPHSRLGRDGGLCMKRDAEAGGREHRQIIGTIADRQRRRQGKIALGCERRQRCEFRLARQNRLAYRAGKLSPVDHKLVGDGEVKADLVADSIREDAEAARDQGGIGAMGAHGRDQRRRARVDADPRRHLGQGAFRQIFHQRDALPERRSEIELPIHRARCDRRHFGAQAAQLGKLVQHLVSDNGGFHIGDEQRLFAPRARLRDEIDRDSAHFLGNRLAAEGVGLVGCHAIKGKITRDAWVEPMRLVDSPADSNQSARRSVDRAAEGSRGFGRRDKGKHAFGHGRGLSRSARRKASRLIKHDDAFSACRAPEPWHKIAAYCMTATSTHWTKRDPGAIFDRSGAIRRPAYSALLRELWSLAAYHPAPPESAGLAFGGGHVVLVVPAFLMGDAATAPLRQFLARCGYRAFGWELGVNWGPTKRLLSDLRARLAELNALEGGPVSVVGISLGGVLARDLAHDRPDQVRHVITLASPFRLPTASTIEPLYRLCSLFHSQSIDHARLAAPLPMPATAVFTRDDGVVAWQSCIAEHDAGSAVEVVGSHMTICRNPDALHVVAKRLAAEAPER